MHTILSSATKTVRIGDDQPFAIIGERINPTGRKIFQLQLRNGDLSRVEIDVKEQVAGGAMLLDVNMGTPLADEAELMTRAVTLIQKLTDLPQAVLDVHGDTLFAASNTTGEVISVPIAGGAKTTIATSITISRKLVPQRGCRRLNFCAFSGVSGSPAS